MDRAQLRRLLTPDAEEILAQLSAKQHLRPHRAIAEVLVEIAGQMGVCSGAVARALAWLELKPANAIGRLRRAELAQLARSLHRFWRQSVQIEANTAKSASLNTVLPLI